jgi:hypothetical protein
MCSDKNTCETRQTSIYNFCNLPIQTNNTLEQSCKEPKLLHLPPKICFLKQTVQDPTLSIYLKLEHTSEVKNYSEWTSSQSSYTLHSSVSGFSAQYASSGSWDSFFRSRACAASAASSSYSSHATAQGAEVSSSLQVALASSRLLATCRKSLKRQNDRCCVMHNIYCLHDWYQIPQFWQRAGRWET